MQIKGGQNIQYSALISNSSLSGMLQNSTTEVGQDLPFDHCPRMAFNVEFPELNCPVN
jgi:hypothetical protein